MRLRYLCTLLSLMLMAAGALYLLPFLLPLQRPALEDGGICDEEGRVLGIRPDKAGQQHLALPTGEIPPQLRRAFKAAEGSWLGISRTRLKLCQEAGAMQRNAPMEKLRAYLRCRRRAIQLSEEEQWRDFLDSVDLGNRCRGVETAARVYFNKHAAELSQEEAALLAAVFQAPDLRNPLRHPKAAAHGRDVLLLAMGEKASGELRLSPWRACLPQALCKQAGTLYLRMEWQEEVRRIAREELERRKDARMSQAAVVILENASGAVRAYLPAAFPESPRGGQLNGAEMPRSSGSTLKPFVYMLALQAGEQAGSILADVPTAFPSSNGVQAPGNYNDRYMGPISMRQALACSQNIPAMDCLNRHGGAAALANLLQKLHLPLRRTPKQMGLGMAIGNLELTAMELASAYSCLARGGLYLPPRLWTEPAPPPAEQVMDERLCYILSDILSDQGARVPAFGAYNALNFPFRCACKTGTSSNYRDNWCVGYSKEYCVAVWVGNFDNSPMHNVSGIEGAGPIFHRVMEMLYRGQKTAGFPERPEGLTEREIDSRTGLLPTEQSPACYRRRELYLQGTEPKHAGEYSADGRVLLPLRYAEWLRETRRGQDYALKSEGSNGRLRVLQPCDGISVFLDPALPHGGRKLLLRSNIPPERELWSCDSLAITRQNGCWFAELSEGEHIIRLRDAENGQEDYAQFKVEKY